MQKVISFDSQILNTLQLCARKVEYAFIENLAPFEKAEALERGDLVHKMLEIYEGARSGKARPDLDTWSQIAEIGITPESAKSSPTYAATEAGDFFASKMELPTSEIEACKYQFAEYTKFYRYDEWETLALEEVGSKVLYEDPQVKFIYNFKIDRLARKDHIIAPWDYKTSKRRSNTSSISNQFMGYAWGIGTNYVVIDKIGFQKTLAPADRFQRIILAYDQARLDEWVENTIYWAFRYKEMLATQHFEMNLTSCDKYSGCVYSAICEKAPSARKWIIDRDYQRREAWDVAKILEKVE